MKTTNDRTPRETSKLGTRSLALLMFFVMLFTAIGSGSLLSAFAVTKDDVTDEAAPAEAVAVEEDGYDADLYDTEETMLGVKKDSDLAGTGANVDIAESGYGTAKAYVKGSWDDWATPDDELGHNIVGGYTYALEANRTYEFVLLADNGDVFKGGSISGSTSYNCSKSATENVKLNTTLAGNYTFKFSGYDGGSTSMTISVTYPVDETPDTWTVVGSSANSATGGQTDVLFGSSWDPSLTENDLTQSGTSWTWTKNNVQLNAGTIQYKIAKNHAWDTTVPASANATQTVSAAGTYNVTVIYDGTNVSMSLELVSKRTLTVANVEHATVTATYNGTTAQEGESISDVLAGATVNVSVTPDSGYKCTGITSSGGGTTSGSLYSFTLTMPAADTTVSATMATVQLKKIYFSNSVTGYGQVYAYVHKLDGNNQVTDEYLGKYPGTTMTKGENSNIWYIEVPNDETYIQFVSGEGYTTGELLIPWGTYTNPKYYPGMDRTDPSNGGSWKEYTARTNEYTVTDGDTMSASNLFTGITATLYDYYVDDEVTDGWLTGISKKVTNHNNEGQTFNDPYYAHLNTSLMKYANTTDMPKYGVTYPLYFGNLNYNGNSTEEAKYYSWNGIANNSGYLNNGNSRHNAVTGLSGKTLANDTIHYYKNGATNENGAPMAMFDEDFLSGENASGKALATILRTSTFPVRTENNIKSLCLDMSSHQGNWGPYIAANFHNGNTTSGNRRVLMTPLGNNKYTVEIPSGYTQVEWLSYTSSDISGNSTYYKNAGTFGSNNTYKFTSKTGNSVEGSWSKNTTLAKGHTYYEYDSTDGKDNAFITNINTSDKTATIDYYAGSANAVKSPENKLQGFFPFDYNNIVSNTYDVKKIYLDPGVWNSDNPRYAVYFTATQTWANMTKVDGTDYYVYESSTDLKGKGVIFVRLNGSTTENNWDNKWNQTNDLTVGNDNNVLYSISGWGSDGGKSPGSWSNGDIDVPKVNGYADATNHYAHDQGFGMKLTIPFNLNANGLNDDGTPQTFDFSGDDDLWVFVDGKLVLDLGGAHAATTGSINFNTKTVTASNSQAIASGVDRNGSFADGFNTNENYVHTMTIYYMERGMFDSNLKFGFSFHAIPNMFWVDKKIRTKEIINAGFYATNGQTGSASNQNAEMTASEGRFISNFEKSYQDEVFTVTQKVNNALMANGIRYTVDNDSTEYYTGNNGLGTGQYPIYHDLNDCFVGQFTKGDVFSLSEAYGTNNKYVYTPQFSAWDQANNNKALTVTGNNTSGYTFTFAPTTTVQTAIDNLNIKARFENIMQAHTLTLEKALTNTTDSSTEFTLQVLFDFDYDGESESGFDQYIAYPLYYTVDGQSQYVNGSGVKVPYQLSGTGTLKIKAGQVIEIEEIPENAKIKIVEVLEDTVDGYRYDSVALTKNGAAAAPTSTVTKGITFTMGDGDMKAVFSNKKPDNKYTIKYIYPAYRGLYSNQSYTVSGVFTPSELKTYLTLDNSGNLVFIDDNAKKNFVNKKAPYEDNFMQTLDFSKSTVVDTGNDLGWNDGDYSCEVNAIASDCNTVSASFNLPYAVDPSTLVPVASEGRVTKLDDAIEVGARDDITMFDWYVTAGQSRWAEGWDATKTTFVRAPLIIYNGDTPFYFNYWSIKKAAAYGMSAGAEYSRCYDYDFNYSLFMNSVIEPIYATTWAQTDNPPTSYDMYDRFDPEAQILADKAQRGVSIAFLENSRNQYNNNGNGGRTNNAQAADVIYSDFLLSFNYAFGDGYEQLNQRSSGSAKAGLVIEAVDYMDGTNAGGFDFSKDYSTDNRITGNAVTMYNSIKTWLQGGETAAHCVKSEFDVTALDNKNCIQYYYSLNNRKLDAASGQLLNTLQNRYKVFRAYSYIGEVNNGTLTNVQLSQPIYFTIYDTGRMFDLPNNATGY